MLPPVLRGAHQRFWCAIRKFDAEFRKLIRAISPVFEEKLYPYSQKRQSHQYIDEAAGYSHGRPYAKAFREYGKQLAYGKRFFIGDEKRALIGVFAVQQRQRCGH